jgi:hypothetical protein
MTHPTLAVVVPMQMTLRNRVLDLLPVVVVFALVTAFAVAALNIVIISEPLRPAAHHAADDGPSHGPHRAP